MGAGIAPTDPFIPLPGYRQITLGQQIGNQQTPTVAGGSFRGRFSLEEKPGRGGWGEQPRQADGTRRW